MTPRPFRRVVAVDDRDAWLAARRWFVTASDASKLLGDSRWARPDDVVRAKVTGEDDLPPDAAERVALGAALEEPVLRYWAQTTRRRVRRCRDLLASTRWPWLAASPDGWAYDEIGGFALVEVKVTSSRWGAEPPRDYVTQVRVQMAVTGVHTAYLVGLCASTALRVFTLRHDAYEEARIVGGLEKVWNDRLAPFVRNDVGASFTPAGPIPPLNVGVARPYDDGSDHF